MSRIPALEQPAVPPSASPAWQAGPVEGLSTAPCALPNQAEETCTQHAISVDIEDWQQSVFDRSLPVSDRFITGTNRLLEILHARNVKATFFILGNVAEAEPGFVRELADAGHELQTHGYDHREVREMSPAEFREDVTRAKGILEDLTGRPVTGYRAPRFSIVRESIWALDVLRDCGFLYDSSIFPMRIRGYGIDGWPPAPHWIRTRSGRCILEAPVATTTLAGRRLPLGGGGYFRVLPGYLIRHQIARLQHAGRSAILYCHPHEFDPAAFSELPFDVPLQQRLHQGLGRDSFARKIEGLLRRFSFGPIRALLPVEQGDGTPSH